MSRSRDIIFAEYRKLFDGDVQKQLLDADDVTTSKPRKLQNSKNGLRQFGKLISRVFLLQIFSCIYRCFECIKQLLDDSYKNFTCHFTYGIGTFPHVKQLIHMRNDLVQNLTCEILVYETCV